MRQASQPPNRASLARTSSMRGISSSQVSLVKMENSATRRGSESPQHPVDPVQRPLLTSVYRLTADLPASFFPGSASAAKNSGPSRRGRAPARGPGLRPGYRPPLAASAGHPPGPGNHSVRSWLPSVSGWWLW